jgi:hypothetical protein
MDSIGFDNPSPTDFLELILAGNEKAPPGVVPAGPGQRGDVVCWRGSKGLTSPEMVHQPDRQAPDEPRKAGANDWRKDDAGA